MTDDARLIPAVLAAAPQIDTAEPGGQRDRVPGAGQYPDTVPGPEEYVPYPGFSSVGFTDDYLILGDRTPYRIPPYSPAPGPSRSAVPPAEF